MSAKGTGMGEFAAESGAVERPEAPASPSAASTEAPPASSASRTQPYRYEAFISYSHTENDARVAREIQRFIEGFSIPRALRGQAGRSRLGKVFRDEDELVAGASLASGLEDAIRDSRWLIVVCSPAAAASPWVAREIETFATVHGTSRVLAVLAGGEPAEAFPPALATGVGLPDVSSEPIAADLRPSVPRARRRAELLRLAAPLIGCAYDDLAQRQRARGRRRMAAMTAAACVCLAVVGGVVYSLQQRAARTEDIAAAERARQEALAVYADGDRIEALRLALDGVAPGNDPVQEAEAQYTLAETLGVYHADIGGSKLLYEINGVSDTSTITVSQDILWFSVVDSSDVIQVYDTTTGRLSAELKSSDVRDVPNCSFSSYTVDIEGLLLVALEGDGVVCFDVEFGGSVLWTQSDTGTVLNICQISDDELVIVGRAGEKVSLYFIDLQTGKIKRRVPLESDGLGESLPQVACNDEAIAVSLGTSLAILREPSEAITYIDLGSFDISDMEMDDDRVFVVDSETKAYRDEEGAWNGSATVRAYDLSDCSLKWEFDDTMRDYPIEFASSSFRSDAQVYPVQWASELNSSILPFVVGGSVHLLSANSGDVLASMENTLPIVMFEFISSRGYDVVRIADVSGQRSVARVASGNIPVYSFESYGFPEYTWVVSEVQSSNCRYAIGCSAEHSDRIIVLRDDVYLPLEDEVTSIHTMPGISGVSSSESRKWAAVFDGAHSISILDGEDFNEVRTIDLESRGIDIIDKNNTLIAFPSNNEDVLVVCDPGGNEMLPRAWVFDVVTGELLEAREWDFENTTGPYEGCVFSSERQGYITISFPQAYYIELFDAVTLEPLQTFSTKEKGITDVMLVNSERYVVVFEDGSAGLYRATLFHQIGNGFDGLSFEPECGIAQIAIAPNGKTIATISPEGGLVVIDAVTGAVIWTAPLDSSWQEYIAYDRDGETIFAQDAAGGLYCYGVENGEEIASTEDVGGLALDISWMDDGAGLCVRALASDCLTYRLFTRDDDRLVLYAAPKSAFALSTYGEFILGEGSASLYRQPIYTLEELEEMAWEEIAEYEGR